MEKQIQQQLYFNHFKQTANLAYPIVIGQLGHIALAVVDNIMIGQLGAYPLAAASLANAIFIQIFIFGLGVSFALSPLVAAVNESGNEKECLSLFHNSFIINLSLGLALFLIMQLAYFLIPYLGQEKEVELLSGPYLQTLALSIIPAMIFQTFRQFSDGLSRTKPAMYILLISVAVNAFLNWLLIYGNWGFPRLELVGAGLATLGTRLFAAIAIYFYMRFSQNYRRFNRVLLKLKYQINHFKDLIHLGIPTGAQYFFEVAAFASVAVIIGWIGAFELAAHQIALNLASITFMFAFGISSAASIRVGAETGKKNGDPKTAGNTALVMAASIMAFFGILFIILRNVLPQLYIDNPAVIEIAAALLVIAAIFQVFDGIQAVAIGILRGLKDVKIPTVFIFTSYWIMSIPVGYILGIEYNLGVEGVWYGFISGLASAAIMLTIRFFYKVKKLPLK